MSEQEEKDIQIEKKQVRRDRNAMRERWSYIILVVIVLLMFVISDAFMIHYVKQNDQIWCELFQTSKPANPPTMPVDPEKHPDQVKKYNDFLIVSRLSQHLGCGIY